MSTEKDNHPKESIVAFSIMNNRTKEAGAACMVANTHLVAKHIRGGEVIDTREVYDRCVTNLGRDAIVDALQGTFDLSTFKYHGCGTGTGDEVAGDEELGTEVGARVEGTQGENTSGTYRSVATIGFTSSLAITEHGLFSAAVAGVLLDRTKHAAFNVVNGDSIEYTFDISFASGG